MVPGESGYIIQSNFLENRLWGSQGMHQVQGFTVAGQHVQPSEPNESSPIQELVALLQSAVGGISLKGSDIPSINECQKTVQYELNKRISFPWLSVGPIPPKRIALVAESRYPHFCTHSFSAAPALGIELVVIGSPGHWLEKNFSSYSHLVEAFIPIDMTIDDQLPDRIAHAVRAYPHAIDGITNVIESLVLPVSRAAELLELPTSPSNAFAKSVNKYEMRAVDGSVSCLLVSSMDELCNHLSSSSSSSQTTASSGHGLPRPPWIVKPCYGYHSLNVMKVDTEQGLLDAAESASSSIAYSRASPINGKATNGYDLGRSRWQTDVLIEEYCSGPEVDANFVLDHGKILFYEVVDNFPCTADDEGDPIDGTTKSTNFKETMLAFPSALPPEEQLELRDSLHRTILRCGYDTGVFHVEARMRNSSLAYSRGKGFDIGIDLRPKPTSTPTEVPSTFLIEINARPPGYVDTRASAVVNGVNLYTVQILLALGDYDRARALSQPFQTRSTNVVTSAIEAKNSGIVASDKPWDDLRMRNPGLMSHVSDYAVSFHKGDRVADPKLSTTPWLAVFTAHSPEGRQESLRIAAQVKQEFHCEIV